MSRIEYHEPKMTIRSKLVPANINNSKQNTNYERVVDREYRKKHRSMVSLNNICALNTFLRQQPAKNDYP